MAELTSNGRGTRALRLLAFGVALTALASCGTLPRSGPNKAEIFAGSITASGDAYIVPVTQQIADLTEREVTLGFTSTFKNAGTVGADTINIGDVLALTVYENVDDGLLASSGQNATTIAGLQVDSQGFIFVPYAGRIRAAGNTPEGIRQVVVERLGEQTPDPQVLVQRESGEGSSVMVFGTGGGTVVPLGPTSLTLSGVLAQAGGVEIEEIAQVSVIRGARRETIWYEDLFTDPRNDIALRNGDKIHISGDPRTYIVMGAGGSQTVANFESRSIDVIQALAQVGGLRDSTADPTGIFVMRDEQPAMARRITGDQTITEPTRMVYVLNLVEPNGLFLAGDFEVYEDDLIYLTEAPLNQFNKVIAALTGTLDSFDDIEQSINN